MDELNMIGLSEFKRDMYNKNEERENEVKKLIVDSEIFERIKIAVDIGVRLLELGVGYEIIAEATELSLSDINSMKP